jgi:hypothetical protein
LPLKKRPVRCDCELLRVGVRFWLRFKITSSSSFDIRRDASYLGVMVFLGRFRLYDSILILTTGH